MTTKVKLDYSRAQAQLEAAVKAEIYRSRKSAQEVIRREFKGVVKNIFAVTPPMGGKKASIKVDSNGKMTGTVDFKKGRQQGALAIAKDLSKAFLKVPDSARRRGEKNKLNVPFTQLLAWYKSIRNRNLRVRGKPKKPAWESNVKRIERVLLAEQGVTAAGWVTGARAFGYTPPSWITRQASKNSGTVTIRDTKDAFGVLVENPTNHSACPEIQASLSYAFTMQANAIARRAADYAGKI